MNFKIPKLFKNAVLVLLFCCIVTLSFSIAPKKTDAVLPVLIDLDLSFQAILGYLKSFVLDHLAVLVAKQILHQITVSVINWINTGFHGSPSFLTNPEGFFLDVADQVSGAFIAGNGFLKSLCSPFNLDLRLNLALGQSAFLDQRYKCTLNTVIANAKKAHVSATVGTSPNGATLGDMINGDILNKPNALNVNGLSVDDTGDFLSGNFGQGGWPAFMALTTQPQNNQYGAYIMARSDMQEAINSKHAAANNDLNRGSGFVSWKKCDTVAVIPEDDEAALNEADATYGQDPTVDVVPGKDGTFTYSTCKTQTPGSAISGTLQKQLNVPADELELANDINAVVDALVSQLVNAIISTGLGSLSSSGAGGHASFTSQLQKEQVQIYTQQVDQTRSDAQYALSGIETSLKTYKDNYDLAIPVVAAGKTGLETAEACFVDKSIDPNAGLTTIQINFAHDNINTIAATLQSDVNPLLQSLSAKQAAAAKKLADVKSLTASSSAPLSTNAADMIAQSTAYQSATTKTASYSVSDDQQAQAVQESKDAQAKGIQFSAAAARYQAACDAFPEVSVPGF
ncbi:MAG: hypothetical protein QOG91_476 [Candidatus Parcubacteria bacterium]|jgi:hypothetical protein|nr:hypothetical protein [Candidatus Parcubacteria bacterium]